VMSSASSAASSAASAMTPAQLEDLSRSLYQRVRSRLAHDLRLERERSGLINHQSF